VIDIYTHYSANDELSYIL